MFVSHCLILECQFSNKNTTKWAMSWENLLMPYANNKGADQPAHTRTTKAQISLRIREQQRRRSACTSVQSDQHLCCSLPRKYNISSFYIWNFKPLANFFCSCADQFESYLVENPKDRFSRDEAQIWDMVGWNEAQMALHHAYGDVHAITWKTTFFILKMLTCQTKYQLSPAKRICVFEHSVMTNYNCACPAIQRGQGSGFLSEGSSWLTACMSEQRRFWRDCADAQASLNLRCSHRR